MTRKTAAVLLSATAFGMAGCGDHLDQLYRDDGRMADTLVTQIEQQGGDADVICREPTHGRYICTAYVATGGDTAQRTVYDVRRAPDQDWVATAQPGGSDALPDTITVDTGP